MLKNIILGQHFHVVIMVWILMVGTIGFAESFTNRPTASGMGDIVEGGITSGNAVYEREVVVGYTNTFLPYCGHGQSYFVSLQRKLEWYLYYRYIDHDNGPLTDEKDDFIYFNLDNWRATAGLNANGFRRSTDGTTFYYGQMQGGDIIGLWIIEDLQAGFGALKWILAESQSWTIATRQGGTAWPDGVQDGHSPTWIDAKTLAEASWNTNGWAPSWPNWSGYPGPHAISAGDVFYGFGAELGRIKSVPSVSVTSISNAVAFYIKGYKPIWGGTINAIYDDNGDGVIEGIWTLNQESASTSMTWTGDAIGGTDMPIWCNEPASWCYSSRGYLGLGQGLIKYNFTNE